MSNHKSSFHLGSTVPLDGSGPPSQLLLPAHHLVTHGVIVGMTMTATLCCTSSSILNR